MFPVDIFIRSVSRMGDPSWRYLEDVAGSYQESWRIGMVRMYLLDPTDLYMLKVSCHYLYYWLRYKDVLPW